MKTDSTDRNVPVSTQRSNWVTWCGFAWKWGAASGVTWSS